MSEERVLNPFLYAALRRRFGHVKVSCQGQPFVVRQVKAQIWQGKDKRTEVVSDYGEYYVVCCPYCKDDRFRLYINHRWNTKDQDGAAYGRGLIHCFNEGCVMREFSDELKTYVTGPCIQRPIDDLSLHNNEAREVVLPGNSVPLASLSEYHPAITYIKGRNFDPKELTDVWGVHYCLDSPHGLERGRLVIPMHWQEKLVGYQCRSIDGSEPKYYTKSGFNKSKMLYNGDRARQYKFGVVVESVFGVWRVGPQCVSILGKSMSFTQRELAQAYWGTGGMCIMLDPDAMEDMERIAQMLNQNMFRRGVFTLPLPDEKDPDEFERAELWSLIANYARVRNIPLVTMG